MAFKEGDFLEVEYTVWDNATSSMIATTDEKRAKEADIYNEKTTYGPVLLVIGSAGVIRGLDREIRNMKEGESKKFVFQPGEAFGERSEDRVRVMPMSAFRERNINPYPGMEVELDNVTARVKSVTSGRVIVDANHPYAGKEISYEVKVIKVLSGEKERVEALAKSHGVKPSKASTNGDVLEVVYDNNVAKNADYFIGKASFIAAVFSYMREVRKVEVKEEYFKPEEKKEEKQGK